MSDSIPMPSVVTKIKVGGFTLLAYAYRPLTRSESILAVRMYKQHRRIKKLPAAGTGKVITQFGSTPSDFL